MADLLRLSTAVRCMPFQGFLQSRPAGTDLAPMRSYLDGGLQMQIDLAIGPAGDVWVMNNWEDIDSGFGTPNEALSTRCGGQGVTIFHGMAKPARAPQIGPERAP